ncbi:MAG: hypothetical protein LBF75_02370 [Treponema sp.]|jgi:SOS-response transcriptional repressor LexA|nr:hypothetical protein [Treponema sp.]
MKGPTQRQGEVLHFIGEYLQTHKQEPRRSRTMNSITQDRLVSKRETCCSLDAVKIPLLGVVTAGRPIRAVEKGENPHYTPTYCTGDQDLRLFGRVLTIIRSY